MFETILEVTDLPASTLGFVALASLVAGLVRGFAGFGLSAVMFASVVTLLPPIELIPVTYILEGMASVVMFRGGMRDADMGVVWGLTIFSAIGVPLGLFATTTVDPDTSKLVALILVLILTLLQLFQIRAAFLSTKPGLYSTGLASGIATGLASIGGMVVALYVLSQKTAATQMRASLVMYLFLTMFTSIIYLLLYEVMTMQAVWRGLCFGPIMLVGVFLGKVLFRPSLIQFYKTFCLLLLITLCVVGLSRQLF